MIMDAATKSSEDREALLRELDHRVRNNLSVLLSMVMFQLRRPPESAVAALSRIAGQIMALSTVYDMTRGKPDGEYESAVELCSSFIAKMSRELCPLCEIEFTTAGEVAEIPVEVARTLGIALSELLLDSSERSARAGLPPRIRVSLSYEGSCRFSMKISDPAPQGDERLMAPALANALGGELRTTGGPGFTERELTFSSADPDGACRDLEQAVREPAIAPPAP